jgi:hypothetical protein
MVTLSGYSMSHNAAFSGFLIKSTVKRNILTATVALQVVFAAVEEHCDRWVEH